MANVLFEPVVLDGRKYSLRHIGPQALVDPGTLMTPITVLNRTDMVSKELPVSNVPFSSDFVQGTWTGRIGDAGDFSLTFPNKESSDGVPWRNRFTPDGKNQWIEIRNDGYLEFVGCIEKVEIKRDQINISGHDGYFQLKSAYERDWICVLAPRDVIDLSTRVWFPVVSNDFNDVALPVDWSSTLNLGGTATINPSGGVILTIPDTAGAFAQIGNFTTPTPPSAVWSAIANFKNISLGAGAIFILQISDENGDTYEIDFFNGKATMLTTPNGGSPATLGQVALPVGVDVSLLMESDGEWVWSFVNGALLSVARRYNPAGIGFSNFSTTITLNRFSASGAGTTTLSNVLVRSMAPFLLSGSDKGDYVLPGNSAAYPSGGLHARYYNDADLQSDANHLLKRLSPSRSQAFASSGVAEYANQQDFTIDHPSSSTPSWAPTPGVSSSGGAQQYFSVKWFGAIYLKLSQGDYTISFATDDGVRVWIGKTQFGDQIIDSWILQTPTTYTATLSAASLGGKDGWYPIRIEYFQGPTFATAQFKFTPPASYTDPGGTALTSGASVTVPATSLSPLGMVDQRNQGISNFDLAQKTALAFGYQMATEPQSLESGLFPGTLAPRIREGHDYNVILEPDDRPHSEGIINYGNSLDATDTCTSIIGNGAGFQNGTQGQLQAVIYDHVHLAEALFDIQAWQDSSDASFISLLRGILNSQLGLRLDPWQLVTGDPIGRPRLANTIPLPSPLAQMRWRPGDGVFVRARDVGIEDTSPRQLLLVTRQISPHGVIGTQVSFAARPRTEEFALKQAMFQATRWQRNYQRQLTTLQTDLSPTISAANIAIGGFTAYAGIALSPSDSIVNAYLRIPVISPAVSVSVEINGTIVDSTLGGPWTQSPINLDITAVAQTSVASLNRLYVRLKNNSGTTTSSLQFQLVVDILR